VINKKIKILILIFFFNFLLVNNTLGNEKDYFLTLKYNKVKVRQGPSFKYPVKFIYKKKYLPVKIIDSRDNFKDSTEYNFQINLKRGSYSFLLKDEMEDGISVHWWNRNSAPEKIGINGTVQFLSLDGDTLHTFDPDFGQEIQFNFHVGALP